MRGIAVNAIPPGENDGDAAVLVHRGLRERDSVIPMFGISYPPFIDDEDEHQPKTE